MLPFFVMDLFKEYFSKKKGYRLVERSSMINEWNDKDFNKSIGCVIKRELKSGFPIKEVKKDDKFAVIQPCIRFDDLNYLRKNKEKSSKLTCFTTLCSVIASSKNTPNREEVEHKLLMESVEFFNSLGISKDQLKIHYFNGGSVKQITHNKVNVDFEIEPDKIVQYAEKLGFKKEQFFHYKKGDIKNVFMLSLRGKFNYVGYRSEIFFCRGTNSNEMIEIATLQYYPYISVWEGNNIKEIKRADSFLAGHSFGLERIVWALSEEESIFKTQSIFPLYDYISRYIKDKGRAAVLTDAILAFHLLVSDIYKYKINPTQMQKQKIQTYLELITSGLSTLNYPDIKTFVKECFHISSHIRPYLQLDEFVDIAAEKVLENIPH